MQTLTLTYNAETLITIGLIVFYIVASIILWKVTKNIKPKYKAKGYNVHYLQHPGGPKYIRRPYKKK
jgi:hypothetical protein